MRSPAGVGSRSDRPNLFGEPRPLLALDHLDVVLRLQVQPELGVDAEGKPEAYCSVGSDRAIPGADLVDAPLLYADGLRNAVAGDAKRFDEFGEQHPPGVDGGKSATRGDVVVVLRLQSIARNAHAVHP